MMSQEDLFTKALMVEKPWFVEYMPEMRGEVEV